MTNKICLFHDYLSDIHPKEKMGMLREARAEIVDQPPQATELPEERSYGFTSNHRGLYQEVVSEARANFGRFAPHAVSAMMRAHGETEWSRAFSGRQQEFFSMLREMPQERSLAMPRWAMDPTNWYLIGAKTGSYELQGEISSMFPCTVFDDLPLEGSFGDPGVTLENIDEILSATGAYQAWQNESMGENGKVAVFDTGVSNDVKNRFSIDETSVGGLSSGDADGHGTAVIQVIKAIAPKSKIESIKVMESYTGGTIWNLISGLSSLYQKSDYVANISVGVSPRYLSSLGPGMVSFKETLTHLISSAASQRCFVISAAGNDGLAQLRWPAAAPDSLAVGGHNASTKLSTFSNYAEAAPNFVLSPGGELKAEDQKSESFGRYGIGLTRDVYGTSFSCAIASGISAILQDYGWFRAMDIPSRISLYRNHCHRNKEGFPILNVADIGAVWPLHRAESGPGIPLELLLELMRKKND